MIIIYYVIISDQRPNADVDFDAVFQVDYRDDDLNFSEFFYKSMIWNILNNAPRKLWFNRWFQNMTKRQLKLKGKTGSAVVAYIIGLTAAYEAVDLN